MTVFHSDRFDGASGSIAASSPNIGGAYTIVGAGASLGVPAGAATIGSTEGGFFNAATGANGNITVTLQFQRSLTDFYVAVDLVSSAASNTVYRAFYYSAFGTTTLFLRKIVAGTVQGISTSVNITALDGNPHTLALQTEEIAGGIRARLFLEGTQRLTWDDTSSPILDSRKTQVVGRDVRALDLVAEDTAGASDTTGPSFTSSATFSVPENTTAVGTVTATDATGPVTFSIVGGADAARFSITSGGVLTFVAAPNFEAPNDADTNNTYVVTVRATDAVTPTPNTTDQTITVTVTNVSPEVAPGTPGGMVPPAVQPVPVQVTFGTATDAATYEMRIKRGTDAFGAWVTGLATPVNIFTGIELDTIYTVECVGRNAIGASATAASSTFRVTNSGVTVDGSTFVAALLAVLNP